MKIVRIIARLNVGGPARHVVWLNEALDDDQFQSVLLAGTVPDGEDNMEHFAENHGVVPVFIEEMSRELSPKDLISLWKVYGYLRKYAPDVIHTHTAKAGTIGRIAGFIYKWFTPKTLIGKPRKVQIVHTFHGHVFHSYYGKLKTRIFLFIERCLAKFATDTIVVISEQQKNEINGSFRIGRSEQFRIIPLGLDFRPLEDLYRHKNKLRTEVGAKDGEILVGIIGRLTEVKNHELFLEVVKKYKDDLEESSPKLKFLIVGDGNLRQRLGEKVKLLDLVSEVVFLGNRNDPEVFYADLDIVALTSLNEGTPLSLIEAMACGTPVISTLVGGVCDLLGEIEENRDDFFICERGIGTKSKDASGFLRGLKFLAADPHLQKFYSLKGQKFVKVGYSKDRLVSDIKNLYRDLIDI